MYYHSLVRIFLLTSVTFLSSNIWITPIWSQNILEGETKEEMEFNPSLEETERTENNQESKEIVTKKMAFVCGRVAEEPPVTYAYTAGKIQLDPLFRWDAELLPEDLAIDPEKLCQETAAKLQTRYQQGKPIFFAFEQKNSRTLVCLVSNPESSCEADDSEELFSVEYSQRRKIDPTCITDYQPGKCSLSARPALSIPERSYSPVWWPF